MNMEDPDRILALEVRGGDDQAKIDFIYTLIRECKWYKLRTARELSVIWRCETKEVMALGRTASEVLQRDIVPFAEQLKSEILEKTDFVVNSAMSAKKPFLTMQGDVVYADAPDHRSALTGLNMLADIVGIKAPKKSIHANYTECSLEELIAMARSQLNPVIQTTGQESEEDDNTNTKALPESDHSLHPDTTDWEPDSEDELSSRQDRW
jgi:hypothetical protein